MTIIHYQHVFDNLMMIDYNNLVIQYHLRNNLRASGGTGRRAGLKIQWWQHRESSSLSSPTKNNYSIFREDKKMDINLKLLVA
jgi:hypothetical protein